MSQANLDLLILILIFGIVTLGLDLVVGYARIFSINQALLFGIGAFSYAFCVNTLHTADLFAAWAIAIPIAATLSGVIAIVSLRVSGDYFLVASFGIQLIGLQAIYNWQDVSGGASGVFGLPYPSIFGWQPQSLEDFFGVALVVAVVAFAFVAFLLSSPYGRLVRALGQDEPALAAAGFNPLGLKVGAFILGGSLAAIAGALYSSYNGIAQVGDYSLDVSVSLLAMVIVGGAGRLFGGLLGACLLVELPRLLDHAGLPSSSQGPVKQALFGVLLLAVTFFFPSGITGTAAGLVRSVLGRRRAQRAVAHGSVPSEGGR